MTINNAFSLSFAISNNPEYLKIANKVDPFLKDTYLNIEGQVAGLASLIQLNTGKMDFDRFTTKLLTRLLTLGQVDGGEQVLNYLNEQTNCNITQLDILKHRLSKILGQDPDIFNDNVMKEINNLYGNDPSLLDSTIVQKAYLLEIVDCCMENSGKYQGDVTDLILKEAEEIGERYKTSGKIEIRPELSNYIKQVKGNIKPLAGDQLEAANSLVQQFRGGTLDKNKLIDSLAEMDINEKKNKLVRG